MDASHTSHDPIAPEERRGYGVRHTIVGVSLFAIACSLFLHALLTYVAATTRFGAPMMEQTSAAIDVELAEIVRQELAPAERPELLVTEPTLDPIPEPEIAELGVDVPIAEAELAALNVSDLGDLGTAGDAAGDITSNTLTGASASFFGVEARGSRFVYIVDTSGSMVSGRLEALKIALTDSIQGLVEHAKFGVVRYSHDANSLNGSAWWKGNAADKNTAIARVQTLGASGGTEPVSAFEIAFALTPPPDAIYFMTDGQFSPDTENQIIGTIKRLMRQHETRPTIHTISFVDQQSEQLMRRIARMTGGTYTHVPGINP